MTENIEILTLFEAANLLRLKVSRLRYLILKKEIPHLKIGRSIRFNKSELQTWIESKKALCRSKSNLSAIKSSQNNPQ